MFRSVRDEGCAALWVLNVLSEMGTGSRLLGFYDQ